MPRHFVHQIDPVFAEIGGVYLWYYGLAYALGFLAVYLWFRVGRKQLCLNVQDVHSLSFHIVAGVLLGGRLVEVFFYEWSSYYSRHAWHVFFVWLGGMSTHGVLIGGLAGAWLFCRSHGKSFLQVADQLAIVGAVLMGMGRIGNFIDGQIVGRATDVWWAVKFPDADGFRHPVVLYDGLKNFLLAPALFIILKSGAKPGMATAHGILWYGAFRAVIDFFREYPTTLGGIATGQAFNILMMVVGITLLIRIGRRRDMSVEKALPAPIATGAEKRPMTALVKRSGFAFLLFLSLTIPSDWTQDIPERYGKRHPGLERSILYPVVTHMHKEELKP